MEALHSSFKRSQKWESEMEGENPESAFLGSSPSFALHPALRRLLHEGPAPGAPAASLACFPPLPHSILQAKVVVCGCV